MKKTYMTPASRELELASGQILAGSPDRIFQSVGGDQLGNKRGDGWNCDGWQLSEE